MKSSVKLDFRNSPRTTEYRWAALHSCEAGWWEGKGTADRPQDHRSPNRQETSPPKRGALPAQEPCNLGLGNAGKPSASSQHLGKKVRKHSQGSSGAPAAWSTEPSGKHSTQKAVLLPKAHTRSSPHMKQESKPQKVSGWAIQNKCQVASKGQAASTLEGL